MWLSAFEFELLVGNHNKDVPAAVRTAKNASSIYHILCNVQSGTWEKSDTAARMSFQAPVHEATALYWAVGSYFRHCQPTSDCFPSNGSSAIDTSYLSFYKPRIVFPFITVCF